jgi:ATP-dependent protease ClpP protease subunit
MVELLFNSLDDLEAESNAPIEVFLCSGGGATNCALAIYKRIKHNKTPRQVNNETHKPYWRRKHRHG